MQKDAKSADPYPAGNIRLARTKNIPRPHNYIRDASSLTVFNNDFVLFSFCVAISVPAEPGIVFNRTRFIQEPPPQFLPIRINGERTDVDESSEAPVSQRGFKKITRRDNRVQKRVRKGLLASPGGNVKD